jgi:uncharacterized protein with GYD domain
MPTYVALVNFTDQGIKRLPRHRRQGRGLPLPGRKHGGQLRQIFWTLGQYDLVVVTDCPDDETAAAVLLQAGALGNVRTTTLKAFDAEQMTAIIQRTS